MPTIYHEILIAATSEKIFQALTTQTGLSSWWTPGVQANPETGTTARFPFGGGYFKEMKITELIPSRLVRWSCIAGATEWIGTEISFQLTSVDPVTINENFSEILGQLEQQTSFETGTLLRFRQENWASYSPMFAECNYTWAQFLKSLQLYSENGIGKPWPTQHR